MQANRRRATSKDLRHRSFHDDDDDDDEEKLKIFAIKALLKTGCRETRYMIEEITELHSDIEQGRLSKKQFKRAVATSVSGAIGATVGGVLGEIVAEVVNPGERHRKGATVGGRIGRKIATAICDEIFNET